MGELGGKSFDPTAIAAKNIGNLHIIGRSTIRGFNVKFQKHH